MRRTIDSFGPDGALYVAEGGLGGAAQTMGDCPQVPPVGPHSGGFRGRISRIDEHGTRTTVADNLPSSQTNALDHQVSGVADVEFVGSRLYALGSGAGCSHGLLGTDNLLVRANANGTTTRSRT